MKYELQNVISGKGEVIYGNLIQTVASYLKRSTTTSELVKESEFFRKQETEILIEYITANQLWVKEIKIANPTPKKQIFNNFLAKQPQIHEL
jgi:hypothetical protein